MVIPPGWAGDWHPSPRRQVFYVLAGRAEVQSNDGGARTFEQGEVLLFDDTAGRGHASRVGSTTDLILAVVQLPETVDDPRSRW